MPLPVELFLRGGEAERLHETELVDDELDLFRVNGDWRRRNAYLLLTFRVAQTDAAFVKVVMQLNRVVRKRLQIFRRDFGVGGG